MTQKPIISPQIKNSNLAGLDLLRALAISLVFLFHYPNLSYSDWLFTIKEFGWTGVDLFFVLSGYLIAKQIFVDVNIKRKISLKLFFIKRSFRILPAYLFIVAVYFCIPLFREREYLPVLWRFLTFTQNIGLNPIPFGTFSHAWSLCIEEQFYLVFPLIVAALIYLKLERKGFYIIIAFFLFTWFIRLVIWNKYIIPIEDSGGDTSNFWVTWIYYPTYSRLDGLLTGISIAGIFEFYPKLKDKLTAYGNLIILIGLTILIGSYFLCVDRVSFTANIFGFPIVSFGYGLLVIAAISPISILYKFKSAIISNLAILSYSIYLSHKGIIHLCQIYFTNLGVAKESGFMFFICVFFSIIAAIIMRYFIEKPFLRIRDRLLSKFYS